MNRATHAIFVALVLVAPIAIAQESATEPAKPPTTEAQPEPTMPPEGQAAPPASQTPPSGAQTAPPGALSTPPASQTTPPHEQTLRPEDVAAPVDDQPTSPSPQEEAGPQRDDSQKAGAMQGAHACKTGIWLAVGALLIVVLILLIVLEVQWIRHWNRLLKTRMP